MKVRLNEDKDVVAKIREGLKRTGGYCPCRLARTEENNVCARNSSARSPIPTSRAIAIVCSIIRRSKAARIPPQRLVGADDSVRPSPPQRKMKKPLLLHETEEAV